MKYWKKYTYHEKNILGKRKKFDNNIYTLDIETSSYFILDGKIHQASDYSKITTDEQERIDTYSTMYIWMFSINEDVYYGRTWDELRYFLVNLEEVVPEKKYVFIHNQSFEFQYLRTVFDFEEVMARKSRHVMKSIMADYNIEIRCTYYMSNCALKYLPKVYKLDVEKLVGDLDYNLLRHSKTPLSDKELGYCENDCLVVYKYIMRELETYITVKDIPLTSTGHVRRELKKRVEKDFYYKRLVQKSINTDPIIYNRLLESFAGGYTHSNWVYTNEILHNVDSWDFTSSYPYTLVTHKFPSTSFKKCNIKSIDDMFDRYAYILVVKFTNIKSKYYNNFISKNKCRNIKNAVYDNGRIQEAEELTTTITDIDFKFFLNSHTYDSYEILESYYSFYNYLPKQFIEFVLEKYVKKTEYKNVAGMEVEYAKEKGKFNSLYGMAVTNNIKDEVLYDNNCGWDEKPLSNDEILEALQKEYKNGFLSFSWRCLGYSIR